MNGLETVEQRKAHIRALVLEARDCKGSLVLARARLSAIPEDKKVARARQEERIEHLEERIAGAEEQLSVAGGRAKTPQQTASTRGHAGKAHKPPAETR